MDQSGHAAAAVLFLLAQRHHQLARQLLRGGRFGARQGGRGQQRAQALGFRCR